MIRLFYSGMSRCMQMEMKMEIEMVLFAFRRPFFATSAVKKPFTTKPRKYAKCSQSAASRLQGFSQ